MTRDDLLDEVMAWHAQPDGVAQVTLRDILEDMSLALVPIQPTEAMSDAGSAAYHEALASRGHYKAGATSECNTVFAAMIKAAAETKP